jgi:hypothetical protein
MSGRSRNFPFDADALEVGISEGSGQQMKKVGILATFTSQIIHHEISQNLKHISIIPCVSAGGADIPWLWQILRKCRISHGEPGESNDFLKETKQTVSSFPD